MAKIQTRSFTWMIGSATARTMKEISATPVTPYVSNPSAVGPDRVAGVVAGAVRDDAGVPGVVFLDLENDLHEVGADVGDLGEDTAGDPQRGGAERLPDRESDEARPRPIARNEEQDAEHHEELDTNERHPDAHPRLERDRESGSGLPERLANAVREFACVLIRIPNQATP